MLHRRVCCVLFVLLVSLAIPGGAVEAQCGKESSCRRCDYLGDPLRPGKQAEEGGPREIQAIGCVPTDECWDCNDPLVSEDGPTSAIILETVSSVPASELGDALTDDYRNRLLLHPSRNMLAVLDGCSGRAVSAIVFLPPDKVGALGELGLRRLEDFLAQNENDSQ